MPVQKNLLLTTLLITGFQIIRSDIITVSDNDLTIQYGYTDSFKLQVKNFSGNPFRVDFEVQHPDIIQVRPPSVNITNNDEILITVEAIGGGYSDLVANVLGSDIRAENAFVRVTVYRVAALDTFSIVIGWIYFVAWSLSFYPQVYVNFKRKSVVGLSFDFLALNIIGFAMYSLFNLGLYLIPQIKQEYSDRFPRSLNPVQINDIIFAVHATFVTLLTTGQCFIYERGEQKISITCTIIMSIFTVFILISIILAGTSVILWLDFLYYCSYVKLAVTLIKYIPQAYFNYKRKSTDGFSIYCIFLDFTGGVLSMLQMIVAAYNYDDWISLYGDPTKFGLGLFSVCFDILFIVQHYILYREDKLEKNENNVKTANGYVNNTPIY